MKNESVTQPESFDEAMKDPVLKGAFDLVQAVANGNHKVNKQEYIDAFKMLVEANIEGTVKEVVYDREAAEKIPAENSRPEKAPVSVGSNGFFAKDVVKNECDSQHRPAVELTP